MCVNQVEMRVKLEGVLRRGEEVGKRAVGGARERKNESVGRSVLRRGGRVGRGQSCRPAALLCCSGTHIVSASGKGNPEYASSHLLNRMTAMLRAPTSSQGARGKAGNPSLRT